MSAKEFDLNMMLADFSRETELTPEVKAHRRKRICDLEAAISTLGESYTNPEGKGDLVHHFGTGVYGREIFIPAGQVIVSKIHRGKTLSIIAKGAVTVVSEEGIMTVEAPYTFVSSPFTKRVVISHTDVVWVTTHGNPNELRDLKEVEEFIIAKDFTELNQIEGGEK